MPIFNSELQKYFLIKLTMHLIPPLCLPPLLYPSSYNSTQAHRVSFKCSRTPWGLCTTCLPPWAKLVLLWPTNIFPFGTSSILKNHELMGRTVTTFFGAKTVAKLEQLSSCLSRWVDQFSNKGLTIIPHAQWFDLMVLVMLNIHPYRYMQTVCKSIGLHA